MQWMNSIAGFFGGTPEDQGERGTLTGDAGGMGGAASAMLEAGGYASSSVGVGMVGNSASMVGNAMTGVSALRGGQIAAGLGDLGSASMAGASLVASSESGPTLGAIGGSVQAIGHGIEAYQNRDQIDGPYQGNPFWSETGAATLAGLNTGAALLDPTGLSSMALAGGTMAIDTIGSATGAGFTAASTLGAVEHGVYSALNSPLARTVGGMGLSAAKTIGSAGLGAAQTAGSMGWNALKGMGSMAYDFLEATSG